MFIAKTFDELTARDIYEQHGQEFPEEGIMHVKMELKLVNESC